jgi:hypothetical protein
MRFLRLGSLLLLMAIPAYAQDAPSDDSAINSRLVNLDVPGTTPLGMVAARVDIRSLRHLESQDYTSLTVRYGLTNNIELGFRGVTAGIRALPIAGGANILHGGRDAEFYAKVNAGMFGPAQLSLLGGISFPKTPAQSQGTATLSGSASIRLHDRLSVFLNPRAVFIEDNTIIGVGIGASARVADNLHVIGDWTAMVSGDNTRDTTTGARKKRDVWGGAIRWSSAGTGPHFDFDLGYGNAIGSTTGFSLTPGLGGSAGFYFALTARH